MLGSFQYINRNLYQPFMGTSMSSTQTHERLKERREQRTNLKQPRNTVRHRKPIPSQHIQVNKDVQFHNLKKTDDVNNLSNQQNNRYSIHLKQQIAPQKTLTSSNNQTKEQFLKKQPQMFKQPVTQTFKQPQILQPLNHLSVTSKHAVNKINSQESLQQITLSPQASRKPMELQQLPQTKQATSILSQPAIKKQIQTINLNNERKQSKFIQEQKDYIQNYKLPEPSGRKLTNAVYQQNRIQDFLDTKKYNSSVERTGFATHDIHEYQNKQAIEPGVIKLKTQEQEYPKGRGINSNRKRQAQLTNSPSIKRASKTQNSTGMLVKRI